jgi:hypothetical protein
MTVSSTTIKQVFAGGGTTFAVPFTFTANSQVKVYELDDSVTPYTVTLQVEGGGSDYTIVGTNVVFNSATSATSRIVIIRSTVLTQTFDPIVTAQIDSDSLEVEMDKIVKMIQELDERVDRAAVMPLGSTLSSLEIPEVEDNAGKFLRVNDAEDGLEWATGTEALITNEDITSDAAIAHSKMAALTASRALTSDASGVVTPSTVTTTELQYLSGAGSAVKGISDTKTLTNTTIDADGTGNSITNIENADIKAAAAIAVNKLAALTASRAMVTDVSGFASASSVTATELGYVSGVTSSIQSQINTLGASSGIINYCTNGGAETDTTGWATYADAAATTPVNGTGGAANITWTRSTSSPLRGTASFLLTKDAVNRQGEGVSFDFTPAVADQEGLVQVSFEYSCSANYADSDISVHVYDVTGSALENIYGISSGLEDTGTSDYRQVTFNFVLNPSCVASRLIFHVASTNASAYTVQFDNVQIRPVYSDGVEVEVIVDTKTANTAGGTFTSGAGRTRTISSTTLNARPWCSVASDQFTLIAGRYLIRAEVPAYRVDRHKAYLYVITDGIAHVSGIGSSEFSANAAAYASTNSIITVEISILSSKTFEIRHWCETTNATSGFGVANNLNSMAEIYTRVTILRLGAPYTQWT